MKGRKVHNADLEYRPNKAHARQPSPAGTSAVCARWFQDLADHQRVLDTGDHPHLTAAAFTAAEQVAVPLGKRRPEVRVVALRQ